MSEETIDFIELDERALPVPERVLGTKLSEKIKGVLEKMEVGRSAVVPTALMNNVREFFGHRGKSVRSVPVGNGRSRFWVLGEVVL